MSDLQSLAIHKDILWSSKVCRSVLQCVAVCLLVFLVFNKNSSRSLGLGGVWASLCIALCCSVLEWFAACCCVLQSFYGVILRGSEIRGRAFGKSILCCVGRMALNKFTVYKPLHMPS